MLIDATHAEETRVVVLDGNRLEDFDVETSTKKQLKGNIYLAKVVRVEPSLQAAFVEYGGGRHGFLAFSEIHPDYYQIPVADRERLLAMQAAEAREEEDEDDDEPAPRRPPAGAPAAEPDRTHAAADAHPVEAEAVAANLDAAGLGAAFGAPEEDAPDPAARHAAAPDPAPTPPDAPPSAAAPPAADPPGAGSDDAPADPHFAGAPDDHPAPRAQPAAMPTAVTYGERTYGEAAPGEVIGEDGAADELADRLDPRPPPAIGRERDEDDDQAPDLPPPETIGGESDTTDEVRDRRAARFLRNYRIQEVIKRRQIMLVQVVKEERGTKGAALTSYISLAGRFCVLMPNSPRGGGISRKITSAADRKRLKEITAELDIPQGMGLIVRTAGANRPKPEIRRDCEYLMRLWDDIREHTLRSVAPALIYEEASLIKRAIRDVYSRDIDEIVVDGEEGWRAAHDFMRMLMPSHARKVQLWRSNGADAFGQSLFGKYQVEAQLDAMLSPTVQLRSGGYLVINQAEALVAIDVNSGRSTRERGIEETALRTNLEAADEVARQLRLRDLAGLIVIDFIDMESKKNNAAVERRLKDALKTDRARIQVGHISHFGLLEMSRQRLRPSLAETSFVACPHCGGLGHVRSIESSALHVLRAIEDEGAKGRASLAMVYVASAVIMYVLNHKRDRLAEIEARTGLRVQFTADDTLVPPQQRIERLRAQLPEAERPAPVVPVAPAPMPETAEAEDLPEEEAEEAEAAAPAEADEPGPAGAESRDESGRRRRRRRRRRGGREGGTAGAAGAGEEGEEGDEDEAAEDGPQAAEGEQPPIPPGAFPVVPEPVASAPAAAAPAAEAEESTDDADQRRRRGRRGGRRRRRDETEVAIAAEPPPVPVWTGPTPADPFGGQTYDIFELLEQHEQQELAAAVPVTAPVPAPVPEPAEPPAAELPAHVPVAAEPVAPEPAPPEPVAPEPVAAEPVVGQPVRPLVIGEDAIPPTTPRRGWWRRQG